MSGSHASLGGGAVPKSAGRYLDASPGSSSEDERYREDLSYSSSSVVLGGNESSGKKSGNYLSHSHLRTHRSQASAYQLSPKSSLASHSSSIIKDDSSYKMILENQCLPNIRIFGKKTSQEFLMSDIQFIYLGLEDLYHRKREHCWLLRLEN